MCETQEMQIRSLGGEDPLEGKMATHSSVLAWEIPWIEEAGRLQFMGSQSRTRLSGWAHTHEFSETNKFHFGKVGRDSITYI